LLTLLYSAQWGFHPGGWGKPPLDEYNRPLYGDVFGVLPKAGDSGVRHHILLFLLVLIMEFYFRLASLSTRSFGESSNPKRRKRRNQKKSQRRRKRKKRPQQTECRHLQVWRHLQE